MAAGLTLPHVLALRLYSTAAYLSINQPMRDRSRSEAHPFPATVMFIKEALGQMRDPNATDAVDSPLWRGLRDVSMPEEFLLRGGTELAPMSTSTSLEVAIQYSIASAPTLICIRTPTFMQRGADISFLSAFPAEAECLYPPLTYLQPARRGHTTKVQVITEAGQRIVFTIVEMIPHLG